VLLAFLIGAVIYRASTSNRPDESHEG
jgi:hypothetical protein